MAQQSWSVDASSAGFRTLVDVSKNVRHANQPNLKARLVNLYHPRPVH